MKRNNSYSRKTKENNSTKFYQKTLICTCFDFDVPKMSVLSIYLVKSD